MGQSWTSLRTMMAYSVATNRREAVASAKIRLGSTEALKWYRLDDGVMGGRSSTQHTTEGGALTFAAGLQTMVVASTGFIVEYSLGANPMLHELAVEDFTVVDGHLDVPDRPGLGVTVDEEFVEKYRVRN